MPYFVASLTLLRGDFPIVPHLAVIVRQLAAC